MATQMSSQMGVLAGRGDWSGRQLPPDFTSKPSGLIPRGLHSRGSQWPSVSGHTHCDQQSLPTRGPHITKDGPHLPRTWVRAVAAAGGGKNIYAP